MDSKYAEWIDAYRASARERGHSLRGMCSSATREMIAAFPELVRRAGWVSARGSSHWTGEVEHFWCEAPDGSVVDPTASQFELYRADELEYRVFRPGDVVRVGRCMNCGDQIYRAVQELGGQTESVCSPECREELVRSLS